MRHVTTIVIAVILAAIMTSGVTAHDTGPQFPSPDQIRQQYREISASWQSVPVVVLQAFVGGEDRFFFERPVGRSTITRQVAIWQLHSGAGRLQYLALALVIGNELSHEEVLNWYVNQIFLGQSCFGISGAAVAYFGKDVSELNLEEAAYLAALPRAPALFNPVKSYRRAVERRNFVLRNMQKAGFVSANEAQRAIQSELTVIEPLGRCETD